jgi:N4-gp56 family major capsid protein
MIGGEQKYVMFLHHYQVTDMKANVSTNQWFDIQKAALQGGNVTKNPIYTGALGEYNGVILHAATASRQFSSLGWRRTASWSASQSCAALKQSAWPSVAAPRRNATTGSKTTSTTRTSSASGQAASPA